MSEPSADATMAVFLDLENLVLGARDSEFPRFAIKLVLERLLLRGDIVVKRAYCDFGRYSDFKRDLHEAAFELIEIPHVRLSGKNSADIRMVVDALDLSYTKPHINTFVILSGDSDFSPLVNKLRENSKTVIGCGVKNSTSDLFIDSCNQFLYYDDFVRKQPKPVVSKAAAKAQTEAKKAGPTREQAFEQVITTLEALVEARGEERIYGSMIKPALKRLNPGFSERAHGFASFNELLKSAEKEGLLRTESDGKSNNVLVYLVKA